MPDHLHDPLRPHAHDPNPKPPSPDPTFLLTLPDGTERLISVADLKALPETNVPDCYIVSTGHGTSGPFEFGGVTLLDFLHIHLPPNAAWAEVEVISADGFGNRVYADELFNPDPAGPILLSTRLDGRPMTREEGLVRMIAPVEKDDALRQVKWVGRINVVT
ncbi:MAG: molybdopterin-dependent oxidoreductase [Anaerolineae bacterium]|nr:molybdopterin-dependent oxidoreductase [Anaerolineae bacterium]